MEKPDTPPAEEPPTGDDAELAELLAFVVELEQRDAQRREERGRNSADASARDSNRLEKLDSNIKKSTAFVRKLRNLAEPMRESLLKEIHTLNLTKYLSEITAALVELKLKSAELPVYLELCGELHRTYAEFAGQLLDHWQRTLPKTTGDIRNYSKLRTDLRLFAELICCGVFRLKDGLPVLGNLLKLLLGEKHSVNLNVVLHFCKHCGWDYAGLVSRQMRLAAEKHQKPVPSSSFLSADRQKGLRGLLGDYFRQLVHLLEQDHENLQGKERQNKQLLITKGEISSKRKELYEESRINFNKFLQSVQQFADALDEEMPQLDTEMPEVEEIPLECFQESQVNLAEIPLWEDDNRRSFYEELPNLKAEVPAQLYKDSIKEKYRKLKRPDKAERMDRLDKRVDRSDERELSDEMLAQKLSKELIGEESDDESCTIEKELENLQLDSDDDQQHRKPKSGSRFGKDPSKLNLDDFLASLLNCMSREMIDKAALDFSLQLNTKGNRRKLIRALFTCPRTRLDLLQYYARLTASLQPIMPLIGTDLVYLLKKDFRFHLKKKDQMNVESKLKNVRFIGELTKFQLFPKEEALQCLKILLLDFKHHHIEMACALLEVCGRFLYLTADTHHKCHLLLQQMMRKKQLLPLQPKYLSMIENSFYNSYPVASGGSRSAADSTETQELQLSPQQLYCRHLIRQELTKGNIERVLRQLKRFNYADPETHDFVVACFTEVWNVKFFNVRSVANCLAALDQCQPAVTFHVVDAVLEDVRLMLEIGSIKYSQRRIAIIKFLGELYNYRLVDSGVIVNTLYLLITYAVNPNYEQFHGIWREKCARAIARAAAGEPTLNAEEDAALNAKLCEFGESDLDPADNLFRVRLVCLLLETTGPYFTTLAAKRKLNCFMLFFQMYFHRKRALPVFEQTQFSVDTEFLFYDQMRQLRPSLKLKSATDYQQAYAAVQQMLNDLAPSVSRLMPKLDQKSGAGGKDLQSIAEHEDDAADEDDDENEEDDEESGKGKRRGRLDQEEDEDEETVGLQRSASNANSLDNEAYPEEDEDDDDDVDEEEEEDDDDDQAKSTDGQHTPSVADEEDDEFRREFERMITESIVSRDQETRHVNADIVIPTGKLDSLNKPPPARTNFSLNELIERPPIDREEPPAQESFNVILMTKAKNRPQLRKIAVPLDSRLAIDLREKERAEREEKEMVKRLTLDINQRRELEDEMLERGQGGGISLNLNRDSRRKYNHLKGVPDADLIFGSNKRR